MRGGSGRGAVDAVTTDNVILAGFAAQPQYPGELKVVGKPFSTEKLRRRPEEGRHRVVQQSECRPWKDGLRRIVAEGGRSQCRPLGLQGRHLDQSAEARRLRIGSRQLRM